MANLGDIGLALGGVGSLAAAAGSFFGGDSNYGNNIRVEPFSRKMWHHAQIRPIQDRVKDAKKAGIHPLYAMGASPGASTPIIGGQDSPRPSKWERAGRHLQNVGQMALIGSEIRKNDAEARYANSLATRTRQSAEISPSRGVSARARAVDAMVTDTLARTTGVAGRPEPGKYKTVLGSEYTTRPEWADTEDIERKFGEAESLADGVMKSIVMRLDKLGVRGDLLGKMIHDAVRELKGAGKRGYSRKERGRMAKRAMRRHLRSRDASKVHRRFYRFGDF